MQPITLQQAPPSDDNTEEIDASILCVFDAITKNSNSLWRNPTQKFFDVTNEHDRFEWK